MRRHNHNARGTQRQMQYVPSVSRSSGIDKDGDSLKNTKVQEEYRAYIEEKLNAVLSEAGTDDSAEENVLILFRKLREGLYSSKRTDLFALEVYETSLYLSVVFNKPRYISSIIPHLLFELYPKHTTSPNLTVSLLVSLLHNLAAGFPSQLAYREILSKIPPVLKFESRWIRDVSKTLRTSNYTSFERLINAESLPSSTQVAKSPLATRALASALAHLQLRARKRHWDIVRSAYRELALHADAESRIWLSRCLALPLHELDEWIRREQEQGRVRQKEGVEGRWLLVKGR